MKKIIFLAAVVAFTACHKSPAPAQSSCTGNLKVNEAHPLKDSIQKIISKYVSLGIPGVQVAVKNADGFKVMTAGFADINTKQLIQPCAVSWIYSVTKAYTAVLIMKQKEAGRINLDEKITTYLPAGVSEKIKGSEKITVRQLMNHSSGLADFISLPEFLEIQFNRPQQQPAVTDIITMLTNRDLMFTPGSDFSYSNTNYLLLQVILENVTKTKYESLLQDQIIRPLRLQQTYFNLSNSQIATLDFPHYYYDPSASGTIQDVSPWNNALGNASNGWGGIAATAADAIQFYENLMQGKAVSAASLQEMKTWIKGKESTQPDYGLGMEYFQYTAKATPQIGHEGDGIGNTTLIFFSPDNNTYMFVNITVGRKLGGPFLMKTIDLKNELATYVANWKK